MNTNIANNAQPSSIYASTIEMSTKPIVKSDVTPHDPSSASISHLYPPSSSRPEANVTDAPGYANKGREWRYLTAIFCAHALGGWNDGTLGPLLPVIQTHYGVNYTIVSLLFVSSCVGFISGAIANVYLDDKIKVGFGKIMLFGSILQNIAYAIIAPQTPFPVMVLGFGLASFGMCLQMTQANGFIGKMSENRTIKLSILHACYGVGAFIAPIVSTYFSGIKHWSYHFIVSAGLSLCNIISLALVFRGRTLESLYETIGIPRLEALPTEREERDVYGSILQQKSVHLLAVFLLIYEGVEVTVGGWIVTFVIKERSGSHSSGYISSGFWGGVTVGRLALIWVSNKVGKERVIFLYAFLALILEVTVWVVPSIVENGIAVSFIGFLLGPMFPLAIDHATQILPPRIITGCIGWICGIGTTGSAALPFITGLLSTKYGLRSLQPFLVSMMCVMFGLWGLVPKQPRRSD